MSGVQHKRWEEDSEADPRPCRLQATESRRLGVDCTGATVLLFVSRHFSHRSKLPVDLDSTRHSQLQ